MSADDHDYWCTYNQVPGGECDCVAKFAALITSMVTDNARLRGWSEDEVRNYYGIGAL